MRYIYIYKLMYTLLWRIILSWVRWFTMIFTSDEVTSENHCESPHKWQKKSLFMITHTLSYFLYAILCPEHANVLKTIINHSFHHCHQRRSFLTNHCEVTTVTSRKHEVLVLWHHIDCFCTCKLMQKWSSLVNKNSEYWFPTNQCSWIDV